MHGTVFCNRFGLLYKSVSYAWVNYNRNKLMKKWVKLYFRCSDSCTSINHTEFIQEN